MTLLLFGYSYADTHLSLSVFFCRMLSFEYDAGTISLHALAPAKERTSLYFSYAHASFRTVLIILLILCHVFIHRISIDTTHIQFHCSSFPFIIPLHVL